jgi:hypothetical protein
VAITFNGPGHRLGARVNTVKVDSQNNHNTAKLFFIPCRILLPLTKKDSVKSRYDDHYAKVSIKFGLIKRSSHGVT